MADKYENLERFLEQYAQRALNEETHAQEAGKRAGAIDLEDLRRAREFVMQQSRRSHELFGLGRPPIDEQREDLLRLMQRAATRSSIKVKVKLTKEGPLPANPHARADDTSGVPVVQPVDLQDHIMAHFTWAVSQEREWRVMHNGTVIKRGHNRAQVNMELGEYVQRVVQHLTPMVRELSQWGLKVGV